MILTYSAVNRDGESLTSTIEANDVREATESLRDQGLFVTAINESKAKVKTEQSVTATSKTKLKLKTLTLFTRQMAMLLHAGSAVVPALSAIRRQMPQPKAKALLAKIISDLEEGLPLTDSLRRFPLVFDPVYCAIVAAGEASGHLADMFERLAEIVQRRRSMRNKILGSLTYPVLLILMSVQILAVLVLFVLPRFSTMFTQLAVEPPALTQYMLAAGDFFRGQWPIILGLFAVMVGAVITIFSSTAGRLWLADVQLLPPLVGRLRSEMIQAQIFRTLGTLINSRVGLLDALDLARGATTNRRFQSLFKEIEEAVTSGSEPSSAFEASNLVEPYICQAIRTGEQSGNMGTALIYCADILDESNAEKVNNFSRLLEPSILIFMGGLVGGVAVSLFLPLFEMTAGIK